MQADEVATLRGFLDYFRATLLRQVDDLTDGELATRLAPSTMTLGGMLKHLAYVEHWWFREVLAGAEPRPPWKHVDWEAEPDWDWHSARTQTGDALVRLLLDSIEESDRRLDEALATGGLDQLAARARHGRRPSLRWILVHMVEEYARHCGHADLIRESLDGKVDL